jgi:hypothetical protein
MEKRKKQTRIARSSVTLHPITDAAAQRPYLGINARYWTKGQ